MTDGSFTISHDSGVTEIVLSRAQQLNSMTVEFFREFPKAIHDLDDSGDTRVIILSADGNHFCAGMDLSVFQQDLVDTGTAAHRERFRRLAFDFQKAISSVADCRVPVIAAIHGACIGGGLDLVSACDMRFALESASFCIQEINLGIMADLGSLQRLPKLMPEGIVRELAFTGEKFDGKKAYQYGLVNQTFATREEMMSYVRSVARRIAQHSPVAVRASKEAITYARDHSVDESLVHGANLQAAIFDKEEIMREIVAQKSKSAVTYGNILKLNV